jgi:hypothetical protein
MESNTPKCTKCGVNNSVIPIVYGKPAQSLIEAAKQGKVKLGGCSMDSKKHYCKACEFSFWFALNLWTIRL